MQDIYIFIVDGKPAELECTENGNELIESRGAAMSVYAELADVYTPRIAQSTIPPHVRVIKANPADNTCYDVTMDIAELAFDQWDDDYGDDIDAPIPPIFFHLGFERADRHDNREHRTYTINGGYPAA